MTAQPEPPPPRVGPALVDAAALPGFTAAVVPRRRVTARLVDTVLGGLGLLVAAPLLAGLAAVVRCTSRGPALFHQVRVGRAGRTFVMLKFRTMYVDSDDRLHRDYIRRLMTDPEAAASGPERLYKLTDDPRITPVGRWLRRTSLDELPQLINVLRGEMALVGPRPVLPWEVPMFGQRYLRRFEVLPGITGLWQTSGRNRLTMAEALELDIEYVQRQSLLLDLQILFRTVPVLLRREGVR